MSRDYQTTSSGDYHKHLVRTIILSTIRGLCFIGEIHFESNGEGFSPGERPIADRHAAGRIGLMCVMVDP